MKINVIISTIVFSMSLASHAAGASNITELRPNDPWCNPSYCYPPPGYGGGSGSTTGSDPEPDRWKYIQVACTEPVQERYAKVLEWYVSQPIGERLYWYQLNLDSGEYFGGAATLPVVYYVPPGNNVGEEIWEIVDPYAAVPIAATPLNSQNLCWTPL